MIVKETKMRCSRPGCGYSHHESTQHRRVYCFMTEGYNPIILCEKCVEEMYEGMMDAQVEMIPRVNGQTGEVKMVKKPQHRKKKVMSDE